MSAPTPASNPPLVLTFQDRVCRHFQVPHDRYEQVVLHRVLYPHTHAIRNFLVLFNRAYFAADRDFIAGVGRLTRRRGFHEETQDFQHHPDNRGFLRQTLRLRASATRFSRLFNEVWAQDPVEPREEDADGSRPPLPVNDRPPSNALGGTA